MRKYLPLFAIVFMLTSTLAARSGYGFYILPALIAAWLLFTVFYFWRLWQK